MRLLLLLTFIISLNVFGRDSAKVIRKDVENKVDTTWEQMFFTVAPRIGAGIHYNPFFEIGVSGIHVDYSPIPWSTVSFYTPFVIPQTSKKSSFDTFGAKLGVQSALGRIMWGIEGKVLTFDDKYEYYLLPKIGLSLLDTIVLEYGVSLGNMNDKIINTRHSVGVNISLNRKFYEKLFSN
jgi:hypothetical protein